MSNEANSPSNPAPSPSPEKDASTSSPSTATGERFTPEQLDVDPRVYEIVPSSDSPVRFRTDGVIEVDTVDVDGEVVTRRGRGSVQLDEMADTPTNREEWDRLKVQSRVFVDKGGEEVGTMNHYLPTSRFVTRDELVELMATFNVQQETVVEALAKKLDEDHAWLFAGIAVIGRLLVEYTRPIRKPSEITKLRAQAMETLKILFMRFSGPIDQLAESAGQAAGQGRIHVPSAKSFTEDD